MLDVNTVNKYPTHFARAIELIIKAREKFGVPSENWPHPIEDRFGIPNDNYYAEIWVDGMDWQPSYWVLEEKNLEKPHIEPFIIFKSNGDRLMFNDHDFSDLIRAALWYRRDWYWIQKGDLGYFTDMVWPFLHIEKRSKWSKYPNMIEVYFKHASQPKVDFFMNQAFFPKHVLERIPNEDNRSDWNPTKGHSGSVRPNKEKIL